MNHLFFSRVAGVLRICCFGASLGILGTARANVQVHCAASGAAVPVASAQVGSSGTNVFVLLPGDWEFNALHAVQVAGSFVWVTPEPALPQADGVLNVRLDGEAQLVVLAWSEAVGGSSVGRVQTFLKGFSFIFIVGLLGLSARWVKSIIGGGGHGLNE